MTINSSLKDGAVKKGLVPLTRNCGSRFSSTGGSPDNISSSTWRLHRVNNVHDKHSESVSKEAKAAFILSTVCQTG